MKPSKLPLNGTCRCGGTSFRIGTAPIMTAACHCTGCQSMSGSAFSLTAIVPSDGFEVTAGAPVPGGIRGPDVHHHFCPDCMTWMFTRIEGMDDFVNIRPTLLEDRAWFSPFIETMTAEKLSWAQTPARHSFEGFPPPEDYGRLMAAYAGAG